MRVERAYPWWGRLSMNYRTFVWLARRYPGLLASNVVMNEQDLARFLVSRQCEFEDLQPLLAELAVVEKPRE